MKIKYLFLFLFLFSPFSITADTQEYYYKGYWKGADDCHQKVIDSIRNYHNPQIPFTTRVEYLKSIITNCELELSYYDKIPTYISSKGICYLDNEKKSEHSRQELDSRRNQCKQYLSNYSPLLWKLQAEQLIEQKNKERNPWIELANQKIKEAESQTGPMKIAALQAAIFSVQQAILPLDQFLHQSAQIGNAYFQATNSLRKEVLTLIENDKLWIVQTEQFILTETAKNIINENQAKIDLAKINVPSYPHRLKNVPEIVSANNEAAAIYQNAADSFQQALDLVASSINFLDKRNLQNAIENYNRLSTDFRSHSTQWAYKGDEYKTLLKCKLETHKESIAYYESKKMPRRCLDILNQMEEIIGELLEVNEASTEDLAIIKIRQAFYEALADSMRLTDTTLHISQNEFLQREEDRRLAFYKYLPFVNLSSYDLIYRSNTDVIPLDGQIEAPAGHYQHYFGQFYRYLFQTTSSTTYLHARVFENGACIDDEKIEVPSYYSGKWGDYLFEGMVSTPNTRLQSLYGIDLRINVSPNLESDVILVTLKGLDSRYQLSLSLDNDVHRINLQFIMPPPWQLEEVKKPSIHKPIIPNNLTAFVQTDGDVQIQKDLVSYPILSKFVEEINSDPLVIAQYICNEIELVDPFQTKLDGVFRAAGIHRNPLGTFLEKQGTPWEQCALLVHLLRQAGYQAVFVEGDPFSLPTEFVERLLCTKLPDESETYLNYPWVNFYNGEKWISIFPWMKEMIVRQGYDVYGFLPDEYASADRWIERYLCNDENILQYIGPDGNDTAGLLFERFVEDILRKQGLSLYDVGIHRSIIKKQFNSWDDFPRPAVHGDTKTTISIEDRIDLNATIQIKIASRDNPHKVVSTSNLRVADLNCKTLAIYFTPLRDTEHIFHFSIQNGEDLELILNQSDIHLDITVDYLCWTSPTTFFEQHRTMTIHKGTCASLCINFGNPIPQAYADKSSPPEKRIHELLSFIGAAYFHKCRESDKRLAALHKLTSKLVIAFGLAKLSPDPSMVNISSQPELRFPQVDMLFSHFYDSSGFQSSRYNHQDIHTSRLQLAAFTCVDNSSNEHQILKEFFKDPYAISTVKLLQIAHKRHQEAGLNGLGFLVLDASRLDKAEENCELAQQLYFSHLKNFNLKEVRKLEQWSKTRSLFHNISNLDPLQKGNQFAYAYMTPGPISSLDGTLLRPASYTGMGTIVLHPLANAAYISNGNININGGFGSRLSDGTMNTILNGNWDLSLTQNSYSLLNTNPNVSLSFNGMSHLKPDLLNSIIDSVTKVPGLFNSEAQYEGMWDFTVFDSMSRKQLLELQNSNATEHFFESISKMLPSSLIDRNPFTNDYSKPVQQSSVGNKPKTHLVAKWDGKGFAPIPDVRQEHKSGFDTVADPVDIVSGAFYVDEIDLTLPGTFLLSVRRNYNSQNPIKGIFGYGWKLGLNPYLTEDDNKLFAAEEDGTVIAYRLNSELSRWEVYPEDNPELRNFNSKGIGNIANPFHAYIVKDNGYILHASNGSKRIFKDFLLIEWKDHAGNTLKFSYEQDSLTRIENQSGGYIGFHYNLEGRISEAFSQDGRRIYYSYDSKGNLSEVTLPNGAKTSYEYDKHHRIIRETKPHGRVLENVYEKGKVVEQRSPIGPQQQISFSARFNYDDGITTVTDSAGYNVQYFLFQNQIYKIIGPDGNVTLQSWFLDENSWFDAESAEIVPWDQPGSWPRSLKSTKDKRGLVTEYTYDSRGNLTELIFFGEDLTGSGETKATTYYVHNARNLLIMEIALNRSIITTYDSTFAYLPKRIEVFSDDKLTSYIECEYYPSGLLSKQDNSGAITLWNYDDRGYPIQKTQKSGTDDPDVVTQYKYNKQGQCIETITPDGILKCDFDIAGNMYRSQKFSLTGKIISTVYQGFDFNNEVSWRQTDDPNSTLFIDYNAAGLIKAKRHNITAIKEGKVETVGIAYTLFEYDSRGNLTHEIDPLGNCIYRNYDAMGRVSKEIIDGKCSECYYEPGGLIAIVISPMGAKKSCEYTTNGQLKTEIFPDTSESVCIYDLFGRQIAVTQNGITWNTIYNDADQTITRTNPQTGINEIKLLDSRGNLIAFTDAEGYIWKKTYDGLNRITSETDPIGNRSTWSYQGDTIHCILPNQEHILQRFEAGELVESYTLNAQGECISHEIWEDYPEQSLKKKISGKETTFTWMNTYGKPLLTEKGTSKTWNEYDLSGNCIASIDGEGRKTQYEFDAAKLLAKKILSDGAEINYSYNSDSQLITCRFPGNITWRSKYDNMGRRTEEELWDGKTTSQHWEYIFENGNIKETKDPLGRVRTYSYDINGQLTYESIGQYTRSFTYDKRGLITQAEEKGKDHSKVIRKYNPAGQLTYESIHLNNELIQETRQEWDPEGRALKIGDHQRYLKYEGQRLKEIRTNETIINYDYSLSGTLIARSSPFHITSIQYGSNALPEKMHTQALESFCTESFQWDKSGKLTHCKTEYDENSILNKYGYSIRGQLESTQDAKYGYDFGKPGLGVRTSAPESQILQNGLDSFGRTLTEMIRGKKINYSYDDMGQLISRTSKNNQKKFQWDPWGRLDRIETKKYIWQASYDALGRRLQTAYQQKKGKTQCITSYYDPQAEFQEIGVKVNNKTFWMLHGNGNCDAIIDENGKSVSLVYGITGSLLGIVSKEQVLWIQELPTPYGALEKSTSVPEKLTEFANLLSWRSLRRDPTGLIWIGARTYDPMTGRFLSPDPIGPPINHELYAYADGDPINKIDHDGRYKSTVFNTLANTSLPLGIDKAVGYMYNLTLPDPPAEIYRIGSHGNPDKPIVFTNGVATSLNRGLDIGNYMCDFSGGEYVYFVYNPTKGIEYDGIRWLRSCKFNIDSPATKSLHVLSDYLFKNSPNAMMLLIAYSEGVTNSRNYLRGLDPILRQQINTFAYCPSAYIDKWLCGNVAHYCSEADIIHSLVNEGFIPGAENVVFLKPHPDAPIVDHDAMSPTFRGRLADNIQSHIYSK